MPLLDVQRRGQQIGRLRIGLLIPPQDGRKAYPKAIDTFRFTTQSKHTADGVAGLYGGEVRAWERGGFEVITRENAIAVTVPPRDQVISQWYEMWNKGGCLRRCDSVTEKLSGSPCLCPHADDRTDPDQVEAAAKERARLAAQKVPQACKAVTRISVMIPDLPGLGVWRIDTGSHNAAVEVGDNAEILQMARDRGVFLPALLRVEPRERIANGETKKFVVPVLEILSTFREIATGQLAAGGIAAQLPPPPGQQPRALTAGQPATTPSPATVPGEVGKENGPPRPKNAQDVADLALSTTDPALVDRLGRLTRAERWSQDMVQAGDDVYEELYPFLENRFHALGQPEGGAE
jgi:hypothetical protein